MDDTYSKLPPGPWRGVLKLDPEQALMTAVRKETNRRELLEFQEVTEAELPFNFTVNYLDDDSLEIVVRNAEEHIILRDIAYQRDRATNKDTLRIDFPPYDSYLSVIFEDNVMEGKWIVPSRGNYEVGFVAHHGKNHRFTTLQKPPALDLTGQWETYFEVETEEPFPAIGEFKQDGNHLVGTFITETGDYRYLEGTVQANKVYLSCFDGAHMFLFEAVIKTDSTLSGVFRNGTHYLTSWTAKRNANFILRDPDSLTQMKANAGPLSFRFPDEFGKPVSLADAEYQGIPKIIQILGTWCPNCRDETEFLVKYLQEEDPDLQVIGLAFERHKDEVKARSAIAKFRDKLEVPYPILHAGPSDKSLAVQELPMLSAIISYPTLIFLDAQNEVVRIHTGFSGPATSEYQEFVEGFNKTIAEITD